MEWWKLDESNKVVPATRDESLLWFDNVSRRTVGRDYIGPWHISTVFLVIEHLGGMFFESIVFDQAGNECDSARYRTWEEAAEGHRGFVEYYTEINGGAQKTVKVTPPLSIGPRKVYVKGKQWHKKT